MTESMGTPSSGVPDAGATETSSRDVAKDEARGVAQDAVQGGKQTADTAKQQANEVASEAASQARALLDQTREQLTSQGSAQKERATSGLRSLADELTSMVDGTGTQSQGIAGDLARQASERVRTVADWLESREPGDVLEDVRRFARQRPGVFLLSAAAVGFLGGRLTRSMAEEARDDSPSAVRTSTPTSYSTPPLATGQTGAGLAGSELGGTGLTGTGVTGTGYAETGYAETGYAETTGVPATTGGVPGSGARTTDNTTMTGRTTGPTGTEEFLDEAPGTPGYGIPPVGDTRGDATAEFAPNAPDTGLGEASTDQMPSEFGARDSSVSGGRAREDDV
jgi:hypothetical protein